MISSVLVGLNPAGIAPGSTTKVKLGQVQIEQSGSAVAVASSVPPGTELAFDKSEVWFPLAEGDFVRPGFDFQQIRVRTASWWENPPVTQRRIMLVITAPGVAGGPAWLRTHKLPRVHGIVSMRDTVAAATQWGGRLQNHDGLNGGNKAAYVHSIDLGHDAGAGVSVRARIDFDQEKIGTGVGGEVANYIQWEGVSVAAGPDRVLPQPLVRWVSKMGSGLDPAPAGPFSSTYLTLAPENSIRLDPPIQLLPGREIRCLHLSSPGLTGWASADVSGDVLCEDA